MFAVDEPQVLHEIEYRTSGSSGPRELTLQILAVPYRIESGPAPSFIATADLQGREKHDGNRLLAELAAEEITALQEFGELPRFDYCMLCGDFYDYPDLRKLGGTGDVTPAINAMSGTAGQTFAVLGNHDLVDPKALCREVNILDADVITTDAFTIGGVSGIVGDAKRNNRKTESDFLAAIDKCSGSRTDVLLLHQGPQGSSDELRGLDLVNQRLKRRSNLLVLFGHCHWPEPFCREGNNLFCNVDARIMAFIPDSGQHEVD